MKKIIYLFIFIGITLVSYSYYNFLSNTEETKCSSNSNCASTEYCAYNNTCKINPCLKEDIDCGKGKCMPGPYPGTDGGSFYCKCEENAVTYYGKFCIPTCDGYSEECTKLGLKCNMEKGRCDTICQGEGSCPEGYVCINSCKKIIDGFNNYKTKQ